MTEQGLFGDLPPIAPSPKLRKVERMWFLHGKLEGKKCGDCAHLIDRYGSQPADYFKCKQYGISDSEATDWRKKWTACGLWKERDA